MSKRLATPDAAIAEALRRIAACRELGPAGTVLELSELGLRALPPEIGQLKSLQRLVLWKNQLTFLPAEIGQLTSLEQLLLGGNSLTFLPAEIGQLTRLKELSLRQNQLLVLPVEIGQLNGLTKLDLFGNQLTTLPPEIGRFTALSKLVLAENRLTELPAEIGQLSSLVELDLSQNQLLKLPAEIGKLAALNTLDLWKNQLTQLPPEIGRLSALHRLYLRQNQLAGLPREIAQLKSLNCLLLHDNPSLGLPVEVLGPSYKDVSRRDYAPKPPREILDYYFRIQDDAGAPLMECKLIVVGRGGAGKTSLIRRLNHLAYHPNEEETHGITIQRLEFDGVQGTVGARVWDFGGQVVLHSMHEFFLTARSLYLLVLGERDDMLERDAAYWLQLIRSYAGDAPVVVALNKSAGRQRQFDRASLEQNYGPILGWVATECSESDETCGGIADLRSALTNALDGPHMDSVRRKFPRKWAKIKSTLDAMTDSFLDYARYRKLCLDFGEDDAGEQEALAGDLHDLGVALNYGRDPRLRETSILRPDWLANGIYALLRANDRDSNLPPEFDRPLAPDGKVTLATLTQVYQKAAAWGMLRAEDYPAEKHEFLVRLMDAFQLSYPLDDDAEGHLIPTLLPLHPPAGSDEPDSANRIRLRYEFHVVPAPLLPWFIARTFSLIPDALHWRRGAILEYGLARAKVWTTQDERYVLVTVAGAPDDRDELLIMIRGILRDLFRGYRGLQVVEQYEHDDQWVPRKTLEQFGLLRSEHDPLAEIVQERGRIREEVER